MFEEQNIEQLKRISVAMATVAGRKAEWERRTGGVRDLLANRATYMSNYAPKNVPTPTFESEDAGIGLAFPLSNVGDGLLMRGASLKIRPEPNGMASVTYFPSTIGKSGEATTREGEQLALYEPDQLTNDKLDEHIHAFVKRAADEHWAVRSVSKAQPSTRAIHVRGV